MAALGQVHSKLTDSARQHASQEIKALMADKAQFTKAQKKVDTQLIFAARMKAKGIVHPAAPKLRPGVKAEADGRYKVEIKGTVTPDLLAAIQAAGGTILSSFPAYHVIQATVPVENMETIAGRDDVTFIQPAPKAMQNFVDSEGDYTHEAIQARSKFGVDGTGVTVGILSDSLDDGSNALNNAIASGNIDPNNTFYITGQEGTGEGEGLAMCEIVHDLAPGATIWFATGAAGEAQMASNIIALANAGCNIIADDEAYPDESPFQDQVIAQAVQTVTAMGVLYFSCARNSGNLDSINSATWEGDFTNAGYTDVGFGNEPTLQFAPGYAEDAILDQGQQFEADLFWSDPLGASDNDYDLYMFDSFGDIIYSSENPQTGTQDPYEHFEDVAGYTTGYYLVVLQFSGVSRFMYLDFGRGVIDWATSGCVKGHNACDAHNALTVAATPAYTAYGTGDPTGPYPNPFGIDNVVEKFSADGPRRMFYHSDGIAYTPGNVSHTGGIRLLKPELTAADGVSTTVPAIGGASPFFGTSAATPHAAAIGALVWSYNPTLTPDQVLEILTNSCIDIMATGFDRDSGNGILMAENALANTPAPAPPPPPNAPTPSVVRSGSSVILSWPTGATTYTLESTTNLVSSAGWRTVSPGPVIVGSENTVTVTISGTRQFFRLSQ